MNPTGSHRPMPAEGSEGPSPLAAFVRLPELRISLAYLVLGCIWILGSDALVQQLERQHPMAAFLHSVKGLNFILITALLLFLALRQAFGGWRKAEQLREAELVKSSEMFRDLSARLQLLQEDERTEIARELHDELGQRLTGIKLKLGLAEKILDRHPARDLNRVLDLLVETTELADDAMDSVRRVASGLRPPMLDHLGLGAALSQEAEEFTQRTEIPCRLRLGEMAYPVPQPLATAAFRIFQESLTNVARHARATEVEASCDIEGDDLRMTVRDNGTGMDPDLAEKPSTLGMLGMWERARKAGGCLDFQTTRGKGVTVSLTLPLESAQPERLSA